MMSVENLRWFHWLGIGLVIGAVAGGLRAELAGGWEDEPLRTISQAEFETALVKALPDGRPTLDQVVVHPPDGNGTWWVTGRRTTFLALHADPADPSSPRVQTEVRTPFKFPAAFPYKAGERRMDAPGPDNNASVADFIGRLHAVAPKVVAAYTYAWYEPPVARVITWAAISGIVVGGIWPVLLRVLIGAGYGRPKTEPAYDLDRFEADAEVAPVTRSVEGMDAVIDAMSHESNAPEKAATVSAATPQVRALPATPPASEEAPAACDDPKSFGGDFYPTILHPKPEVTGENQTNPARSAAAG